MLRGVKTPDQALSIALDVGDRGQLQKSDFAKERDQKPGVVAFYERGRTRAVIVATRIQGEWWLDSAAFCNGVQ
jgi:hypothetical protein